MICGETKVKHKNLKIESKSEMQKNMKLYQFQF
jgi:hypothetical protein